MTLTKGRYRMILGSPSSVMDFGAVGDGVTDDRAAILSAEAAGLSLYFPPGVYRITSNMTISKVMTFAVGAVLKPSAGVTITLSGEIVAGCWQIFDISLLGVISGRLRNPLIMPEWWGGIVNFQIDQVPAMQAAINFAQQAGSRAVFFRSGLWRADSPLNITTPVDFAPGAIIRPASGVTITLTGEVMSGLWQIFDLSLGGKIAGSTRSSRVYPEWFGAATSLSDNTAAFQAALDTGVNVYVTKGDWNISGPITMTTPGQTLMGSGAHSRLLSTSSTNDLVRVGNGTVVIKSVTIRDLGFYATVVKTAGAAIHFRESEWCSVFDCMVSSPTDFQTGGVRLYDGIVFNPAAGVRVEGCDMWGFRRDGIRIHGTVLLNAELTISNNCWITYAERYGVYCGGGFGGLHLESLSISACWRNVCIDSALTGTANREMFIGPTCSIDAASDVCLWIGANAASIIEVIALWCASAGRTVGVGPGLAQGTGVHVDPNNGNTTMRITGGRIFNCAGRGMVVNDGNVFVNDVLVTDNGSGLGAAGHGIWIVAATGNEGPFQVTDCYFAGNAGYDLRIDNVINFSRITDNVFRGTGAGKISTVTGTTATNIVDRNIA
jgi:pectate lyase-like protein